MAASRSATGAGGAAAGLLAAIGLVGIDAGVGSIGEDGPAVGAGSGGCGLRGRGVLAPLASL